MHFEDLILRPVSGSVEISAVAGWLNTRSFAFLDPVAGEGWHLAPTRTLMEFNRTDRVANRREFPLGVRVKVAPEYVWLSGRANRDDLARALEFVQWLTREGEWTATVDCRAAAPVGDPRRFFPPGLVDPALLDDECTSRPVTHGALVTWTLEHDRGQSLVIHSSGVWSYWEPGSQLRGRLTEAAREAWNTAVAAVDLDEPVPEGGATAETAVALEIETVEDLVTIQLDVNAPPANFRPLVALASQWVDALAQWTPGTPVDGIKECFQS
jgi:hypothetical protein